MTRHPRIDAFVSLVWYDTLLRFITNFIAKTSELLLAAGLVVSSANFLTDGAILGITTPASQAWAWSQALAIDSSLAISFYYVLLCFKQQDWAKCILYSLLTGLLALVAGAITNVDIFSHAIHAPINDAISLMGINIKMLSSLRSIAVVGFVLMSRLRDVSFRDLSTPIPSSDVVVQEEPQKEHEKEADSSHLTIEDVALLLQVLARPDGAMRANITVEPELLRQNQRAIVGEPQRRRLDLLSQQVAPDPPPKAHSHEPTIKAEISLNPKKQAPREPGISGVPQTQLEPDPSSAEPIHEQDAPASDPLSVDPGSMVMSREERLERAYQELVAEGRKISGRTLAERAHMHRSLCTEWLRAHQETRPGGVISTPLHSNQPSELESGEVERRKSHDDRM